MQVKVKIICVLYTYEGIEVTFINKRTASYLFSLLQPHRSGLGLFSLPSDHMNGLRILSFLFC